jgi:hypothetical protein
VSSYVVSAACRANRLTQARGCVSAGVREVRIAGRDKRCGEQDTGRPQPAAQLAARVRECREHGDTCQRHHLNAVEPVNHVEERTGARSRGWARVTVAGAATAGLIEFALGVCLGAEPEHNGYYR